MPQSFAAVHRHVIFSTKNRGSLIDPGREITTADLVRELKAGSSRWAHDPFPDRAGFAWQSGYGAFSVST
jgi:hypothetical protein